MTRRRPSRSAIAAAILVGAVAWILLPPVAAGLTLGAPPADARPGAKLPVIAGKEAIASVNGEPVTLDDLLREIGTLHAGVSEAKAPKPDASAVLDRLINARLILQEARRIGLDQLPEVERKIETRRVALVKRKLVEKQVAGITEADPAMVEKLYRDAVRAFEMNSLLFVKQEDATAFVAAIVSGGDFRTLSGQAVAAGKARGGEGTRTLTAADLRPEVAMLAATMKPGEMSAPVRAGDGWSIIKLEGIRYPENPEARRHAQQEALEAGRQAKLDHYTEALRTRYATVDRTLLKSLDYESKRPGLDTLRTDERVVAQVKGGASVRVKDLTRGVEEKFYHGVEEAIGRKRVNQDLPQILDRILMERATALEAKHLGLERGDAFKAALKEQVDEILFDTFVSKVINPEIKIESAELKAYYGEHRADSTTPEMMRIESLSFRRREDAQASLDKLRQGADLKWMSANADGRIDPGAVPDLLRFNGDLMTTAALPEGVRKAVAGAVAGDCRYYADADGPFHVLCVRQVVAATQQPFDAVKADIATRVFVTKRQAAVEDWAARLRKASEIKIFATVTVLNDLLGLGSA